MPKGAALTHLQCPFCRELRTSKHPAVCRLNPDREASPQMKNLRAVHAKAKAKKDESMPKPVQPPEPEPKPASVATEAQPSLQPEPVHVEAPPTRKASIPISAESPRVDASEFLRARVDEYRQAPQPKPVQPVEMKRGPIVFTPNPAMLKAVLIGGLGLVAGFMLLKYLRARKQDAPRRAAVQQREQQATIPAQRDLPRAWSPDPDRVAPGQWVPGPSSIGGGYVPSPQTAWSKSQDDVLKRRARGE